MDVNVIQKFSVHFTTNKDRLRYQGRQIKAIERKGRCSVEESHEFGEGMDSRRMLNRAKYTGCVVTLHSASLSSGDHV